MTARTVLLTRDRGHDLPADCRVEVRLTRPAFLWTCEACKIGRRFHSKFAAFDAAWQHVTGDAKCPTLDPGPPSTLDEMGLKTTFGGNL